MLQLVNEPEEDPRWFKVIVPGHEPGQPMRRLQMTVPLYPPALSAEKHVELNSQEGEDMVVVINCGCIFAPDYWGKQGFQVFSNQPQGAHCPCCGSQGFDDWKQKQKHLKTQLDEALPAGFIAAEHNQQQQQQQKQKKRPRLRKERILRN